MHPEYGNLVLLAGTDLQSRYLIDWLTECRYHHSGILTDRLRMDIMTQNGVISNHLIKDMKKEEYDDYLIVEHLDITPEIRKKIRRINEEKFRDLEYDHENVRRLGKKLLRRKITGENLDGRDISNGGVFCNSRIGYILLESGLPIPVHPSQLIVPHFLDDRFFRIIGSGNKKRRFY